MQDTFEDKMFFVEPPEENANPEEWAEWLEKDKRQRSAAKAVFTRSLDQVDVPEEFQAMGMAKVNGVWVQSMPMGFSGSAEDESLAGEVVVESHTEEIIALTRMEAQRNRRGRRSDEAREARKAKQKARRKAKRKARKQ